MERHALQTVIREWQHRKLETGVRRSMLGSVLNHLDDREIVIISGVRRCGKTTLLFQVIEHLRQEGDRGNVLYVNLEDERLLDFQVEDFERLLEVFHEERVRVGDSEDNHRLFLFLDEVQEVAHWEKWVRRVYDQFGEQIKIFITGSSSFILSSEFASLLSGRNLTYSLRPFSFEEFLRFKGIEDLDIDQISADTRRRSQIQAHLTDYLSGGGFPAAAGKDSLELLQQYYRDILFRDVATRYGIRDVRLLERVGHYLLTNAGNLVSYNKLAQILGGSKDTIKDYVGHLLTANLISELPYFSYSLAEVNRRNRKVYSVDCGLRNAVAFRFSPDTGRLAENAAFLHLADQNPNLFYWTDGNEIDFVVDHHGEVDLINVCMTDNIPPREWQGLLAQPKPARVIRGRMLVSRDEGPTQTGVERCPLWRFLLG
ncbi:MAG: ATP-binding protein [Armatimonadetes bacterium]|nr:ATP-binding protein [Armatimonadota bacterium]